MNVRKAIKTVLTSGCVVLGLAGMIQAQASVVIAGTRVIYNAADPETTIKLTNEGKSPSLVQSWIDNGDATAVPSTTNVPFTVTPPISRIDPTKGQTLRIIYTGEPLPTDKESVFWLNVLEVPPRPGTDEVDANKLQLAFRSRIKLFFRPADLAGSAEEAPARLNWRLTRSGNQIAIEAHNPTPYYVSLTSIEVHAGSSTATFDDGGMVGPGESKVFPLKGEVSAAPDAKVHFSALNDYGGAVSRDAALQAGLADSSR
jgi:chaperone protein EcpD